MSNETRVGNMQQMNEKRLKQISGFTLIEVLITIIVLAIGLLGMAALQTTGLRNNNSAYMRSQATVLAYDMADRIRANSKGVYPVTAAQNSNCKSSTSGCTPAVMAANDIYEWNQQIANILPTGSGVISVASNVYTIEVKWDDTRTGSASTSFKMRFFQ